MNYVNSSVFSLTQETGRSKGFGFITYAEAEDAKKALEQVTLHSINQPFNQSTFQSNNYSFKQPFNHLTQVYSVDLIKEHLNNGNI